MLLLLLLLVIPVGYISMFEVPWVTTRLLYDRDCQVRLKMFQRGAQEYGVDVAAADAGITFSKVLYMVTSYCKCTTALIFQNCVRRDGHGGPQQLGSWPRGLGRAFIQSKRSERVGR